jgi:N-succinyldiaminopimelate aminotransferase
MDHVKRPLLNRRLGGLGNSVFGEMSARALATGSVNLGQGFGSGTLFVASRVG